MKDLLEILAVKGLTLGSIESLTGGLFASTVTSIPGASKVFKGSLVTYSAEEKVNLLGMDKKIIDKYGVVSKEVAREMASLGQKVLGVDVAISFTGNAGPTCEPGGMPVGRVYIGVKIKDSLRVYEANYSGNRNEIREKIINTSINLLKNMLK